MISTISSLSFVIYILCLTLLLLLAVFGKSHISLMLLVPFFPLQNVVYRFHQYPLGKDFTDLIMITLIIVWFAKAVFNNEKIFTPTPFNKLLFILIVYTYVSLWRSSSYLGLPAPWSTSDIRVQDWKNYITLPILFFITVNTIKTAKQVRMMTLVMLFAMVIIDLYTLRQIQWNPGLNSRDKLVATFMWLGPNQVAAFYIQAIFVLIGIAVIHKKYRLMFAPLILAALFITLFMYSRGAYIALILGLLVISVLKKRALILPLLALLIFWEGLLPKNVVDRIKETRTEEGELDSSSQHRIDLWKESFNMFVENPIIGVGFDVIYCKGILGVYKDTHNIYMKVLAEQGAIGILIFLTFLLKSFRTGLLLYNAADDTFMKGLGLGFTACVAGAMTTNFFGDRWTFIQIGAYFWVFLGLSTRALLIVREEAEQREADSGEELA